MEPQSAPLTSRPSPELDAALAGEAILSLGRGKRFLLTPAALRVEAQSGGEWRVARSVAYPEIAAVYRYEVRDWGYLGLGLMYGLVLLAAVLVCAVALGMDGVVSGAMSAVVVVGVLGLICYRVGTVPRRWLRIETHAGPLLAPNRDDSFYHRLAAHLTPPPPETPSPVAPANIPPPPSGAPFQ